jgi:hypothetical protein
MAFVWVDFSPGFLSGAGFSTEQSHHSSPHGKKPVFSQKMCISSGKELRRGGMLSVRKTLLKQPHFTFEEKGAPERSFSRILEPCWSNLLRRKSCS